MWFATISIFQIRFTGKEQIFSDYFRVFLNNSEIKVDVLPMKSFL